MFMNYKMKVFIAVVVLSAAAVSNLNASQKIRKRTPNDNGNMLPDVTNLTWKQCYDKAVEAKGNGAHASIYLHYLNAAISKNVENAEAYFLRGKIYLHRGRLKAAVYDFTQILDVRPKWAEVYFWRSKAYAGAKSYKHAINDIDKAIEFKYEDTCAIYFWRAKVCEQAGNITAATKTLKTLLKLEPGHHHTYDYLGELYTKNYNYQKALESYSKIVCSELFPRGIAYEKRALVYCKMRQFKKAIADCSMVIFWAENHTSYCSEDSRVRSVARHYAERGRVYHLDGEYEKAIADFNKAIELQSESHELYPKDWKVYRYRAECYSEMGMKKEAIADCEKIQKGKGFDLSGDSQIWHHLVTGDLEATMSKRIFNDYSFNANSVWGSIEYVRGDYKKAIEYFQTSLLILVYPKSHIVNTAKKRIAQEHCNRLLLHLSQKKINEQVSKFDLKATRDRVFKYQKDMWVRKLYEYYLGEISRQQLLESTKNKDAKIEAYRKCLASFYIAQIYLSNNQISACKEYLQMSAKTKVPLCQEYHLAKIQLKRLEEMERAKLQAGQ